LAVNVTRLQAVVTQVDCGVRPIPYYPDSISSTKMYTYYQRFAECVASSVAKSLMFETFEATLPGFATSFVPSLALISWFERIQMLYLFIVGFGNVVVECDIIFEPLIIRYGQ
jgi:hypothetical protein